MSDDLHERVQKFSRLELPGQPMGMHMGTSYLVNDLWKEVERLRGQVEQQKAIIRAVAEGCYWDDSIITAITKLRVYHYALASTERGQT